MGHSPHEVIAEQQEGEAMGFIMLFDAIIMILLPIIIALTIIFVIIATVGIISAVVLFIAGKKRPKGKRKWFYIPAFLLAIPALFVVGVLIFGIINPPEHFNPDDFLERLQYENRLHSAVQNNDVEQVRRILEDGADPNEIRHENPPIFLLLYSHDNANYHRATYGCADSELQILELLLEFGADPNLYKHGSSPLHELCSAKSVIEYQYEAIQLLLKYGADPNAEDSFGNSPLIKHCWILRDGKSVKIAQLLLEHGANVNQVEINGHTALCFAQQLNEPDLADFLRANGADGCCSVSITY
jgi:ankyrin repeat protein